MCSDWSVFMLKGILITILCFFAIAPKSQLRVKILYSNQKTSAKKELAYYYTLISGKEEIRWVRKGYLQFPGCSIYIPGVFLQLEMLLMALFKHQILYLSQQKEICL